MSYFKDLLSRGGGNIFLSTFISKILSAILSVVIVRLLNLEEYGQVNYVLSYVFISQTFTGLGLNWTLLRYGSNLNSYLDKYKLYYQFSYWGTKINIIIVFLFFFVILMIPNQENSEIILFFISSISFITIYKSEILKSYFRIIGNNKAFSLLSNYNTVTLFILSILFAFFFRSYGYVSAIVLSPIISLYFLRFYRRNLTRSTFVNKLEKEHITYGLYTSIGSIASQLLFLIGPILITYFNKTNSELQIAYFKVATIIPFNLMILPSIFMTTDFVYLSKNSGNKSFLLNYYRVYFLSIVKFITVPFILLLYFNDSIITFLYSISYMPSVDMSFVLIVATYFSFIFRVPLGNILTAIGKTNWNVLNAILSFFLFVLISYFLYPNYGVYSIALSVAIVIIISGFISYFMFRYYLTTLINE